MTEESKVQIASSAIVCAEAQINGEVTIGEGCVVHPYVIFDAKNGPIIIGDNNLFEEYSIIQNNSDGQPMIIGDSNHFQVKSECRAKYVGSRNVIGILAQLGDGCFVADDCYVAVGRRIEPKHTLENFVSVAEVGDIHRKVEVPNMPTTVQLEFLRKLLPSYHHLHGRKPKTAAVTKK